MNSGYLTHLSPDAAAYERELLQQAGVDIGLVEDDSPDSNGWEDIEMEGEADGAASYADMEESVVLSYDLSNGHR